MTAVVLSRRTINRGLAGAFLLLLGLGTASEMALNFYGFRDSYGFVIMANLSYEGNLPTWYSSLLLCSCAVALFLIGRLTAAAGEPFVWHWRVLGLIFLYISIDEAVIIHETLNSPLRAALAFDGMLYFGWVVPFGGLLLVLLVAYLKFLLSLPRRFALLFILAGAVYVGGALGTELPISAWYAEHGGRNLTYGLLNLVQESLEILGASLFLYALLDYLDAAFAGAAVRFKPAS